MHLYTWASSVRIGITHTEYAMEDLTNSHGLESPINMLVFVICKRQKNHTNYRCMYVEFTSVCCLSNIHRMDFAPGNRSTSL